MPAAALQAEVADETGLPVGIKSAVGDMAFWHGLARLMRDTGRGVDFINGTW